MSVSLDRLTAHTIRGLSMDAVQAANSGHPGMPLGMADAAAVLWTRFLKYDPSDPSWFDRDRFVLSAGHGSMLLYSVLHITGQALTIDDLKSFRQWGSKCAGHPEFGEAPGIETTTGPLGAGFAMGVGMAIAERHLRAQYGEALCNHWTYAIVSDGDLMEGVASEAASLAGHLGLGRIVYLYDDNGITIDGTTDIAFTEDVLRRFEAYGWHVQRVDGHDQEAVAAAISAARDVTDRPSLISCKTVIGYGSPAKAGKSSSHGAPLGVDEVKRTKAALGLDPEATFVVPQAVLDHVRAKDADRKVLREAWLARLQDSEHKVAFERFLAGDLGLHTIDWPQHAPGSALATRKSSEMAINAIAASVSAFLGGSADLAESNFTTIKGSHEFQRATPEGRNIAFGIREHAMGAICNGLALHGLRPFNATFLIFHDYQRPAVRLSALMHQPVVYVYTHDSVWLGEDGPTHQPIESLMSIRMIPNIRVIRPADGNEVNEAWKLAMERTDGPTAIALSRQNLAALDRSQFPAASGLRKGGYVLSDPADAKVTLIGTGSEVHLALDAARRLEAEGIPARVVNLGCWELFDAQPKEYRRHVLGTLPKVSVEAGVTKGWERYVGLDGGLVGIDRFGASAPGKIVAEKLGMSIDNVVAVAKSLL